MNKTLCIMSAALGALCLLTSCTHDADIVSLGIENYYYLPRMKKLLLQPAYEGNAYRWTLAVASGADSVLSTGKNFIFMAEKEGTYHLTFHLDDGGRGLTHHFSVTVVHEDVEYSPYTAKVYDFHPAPGQFVNTMPLYEQGDNEETMRQKVEDDLKNDVMISLGAYGGYVTFAFDHTVVNVAGQKDFYIKGNSFYSDIPEYHKKRGGSAEPGIVQVAFDRNMNGKPDDDEWYELAGSEYRKASTLKHYSICYQRPDTAKAPKRGKSPLISDTEYIRWDDNLGDTGYVQKNIYHTQSYYPKWETSGTLRFSGTRLPPNAVDVNGHGSYYVLYAFDWGYADNHPNDSTALCSFDIDWAVDAEGRPVHLPGADFIRVYTGVNQTCGWIGETSTEVARAQDLHIAVTPSVIPDPLGTAYQNRTAAYRKPAVPRRRTK
jgi:hypothetical protein